MRLNDAGLHCRETQPLYFNHRPLLGTDGAARDRSNRLFGVSDKWNPRLSGKVTAPVLCRFLLIEGSCQ
jgi:hypothetical protein